MFGACSRGLGVSVGFLGGRGWHPQGAPGAHGTWSALHVCPGRMRSECPRDPVPGSARVSGHLAPGPHLLLKTKYLLGVEEHGDKRVQMKRNLELGDRALVSSYFQHSFPSMALKIQFGAVDSKLSNWHLN